MQWIYLPYPLFGNEGVPQGIMQAWLADLPVVSTTVGAISEAVIDGKTGFTLAPQVQETPNQLPC